MGTNIYCYWITAVIACWNFNKFASENYSDCDLDFRDPSGTWLFEYHYAPANG